MNLTGFIAKAPVLATAILVIASAGTAQEAPSTAGSANPPGGRNAAPAGTKDAFPTCVARPLKIAVSVQVNDVGKLNEQTGAFDADIDLQMRWSEPCLAFDVKEVGLDRQEFGYEAAVAKLATIWSPQLAISNIGEKPAKIDPGLFIYSDGSVVYIQHIRGTFETRYQLLSFPFDSEALPIKLISNRWSIDDVEFVEEQADIDRSGVREALDIPGWKMMGLDFVSSRSRGWNGDYYPEIEAQIKIRRNPASHFFVLFVPFGLILLVPTLLTLYSNADTGPRLGAWSGSLLALVAFNFTLGVRYPALDSRGLAAQIVAIGFCYQLFMIGITCTVLDKSVSERMGHLGEEIAGFLRWSVPIILVGLIVTRICLTALASQG